MPFFKYLKNHTYESKNTWDNFFSHTLFQLFKKAYLVISKRPGEFFLLIPFSKYLKNILTNLKHTWDNFFTHTLFQIFIKWYLQIGKSLRRFFLLNRFKNIEKSVLKNPERHGTIFLLIHFFKYLKKNTYQSEDNW